MTNAELIKALRNCTRAEGTCAECSYKSRVYPGTCNGCKWDMMLDAADALEAADIKIDDYTAAIEALDDSNDAYIKENERIKKRIAELEAQLPKEGEWIEDDSTYCGADRANYKCSLCGKIGGTWRRGLKQDELPPFCGSCGARMRGEQCGSD